MQYHIHRLCRKQKITVDGAAPRQGDNLALGNLPLMTAFFSLAIRAVPGIVWDFLSAREQLQMSPWRGHWGVTVWIGTLWDRAVSTKLSVPTVVLYASPQRSAVVFPKKLSSDGHCLELYGCLHACAGIVRKFV